MGMLGVYFSHASVGSVSWQIGVMASRNIGGMALRLDDVYIMMWQVVIGFRTGRLICSRVHVMAELATQLRTLTIPVFVVEPRTDCLSHFR